LNQLRKSNVVFGFTKKTFQNEYRIFSKTRAQWDIQNLYFWNMFNDLLIPFKELSPRVIKSYKLKDFGEFLNWANKNLTNSRDLNLIKEFKNNYNKIAKKI